ncbi:hypothetical protein ABBQ32_001067 [Trebouxia sp. C0010 RCD-2024]
MMPGEESMSSSGHFEYHNRPRHDVFWGILYACALALTVFGGLYASVHRNHKFALLSATEVRSDPNSCPAGPNLFSAKLQEQPGDFSVSDFMSKAATWLLVSAVLSLALGLVFLWVFKWHSKVMTRITIQIQVLIPAIMGIAAIAAGQVGGGIILILLSLLAALVFWMWRGEIDLCARLLGIAAAGLNENPGLLGFVVAAKFSLLSVMLPLLAFSGLAYTNGDLAPNSHRDTVGHPKNCQDAEGAPVDCCMWQPDAWVAPYMTLANVTLLWSIFLVFEIRVFTISGTIAQWYFSPPGFISNQGTTMRSLKHALGASFGSLSLGSLVLTVVQLLRNAMENARQQAQREGGSLLVSLASCLLECVYSLIDYLTKFATVRMAITGEAFLEAARRATDLLARNFLKAYGVWWFPPMVLNCAAFLLSLAWGLLIFTLSWLRWQSGTNGTQEAAILGALCFVMALVVLLFFSSVLLNIVDAVFMCYALDLDTQSVTKAEVHEVFSQVPVGVAVEQPGGDYAYGAPASPQRAHGSYVPPSHPAAAAGHSPMARRNDSAEQV